MAIGSRDPITLNQITSLAQSDITLTTRTSPQDKHADSTRSDLILLQPPDTPMAPEAAARELANLALQVSRQEDIPTILLSGGDTAAAFVREAGIDWLTPVGALAQGIPVSRACTKEAEFYLITKSGGFGAADALIGAFRKWQNLR